MSVASWFVGLTAGGKVAIVAGVGFFFAPVFIVGSVISLASLSGAHSATTSTGNTFASAPEPTASATPVPVTKTVNETETLAEPFAQSTVEDGTVAAGVTAVTTIGVPGTREKVYSVTYIDGVESARELLSDGVVIAPRNEVTTVGTYVAPPPPAPIPLSAPGNCDSNYSGACVPISSDVDCAGGSGNGPAYVSGPVTIVGSDIYDLDRDGDGIACDR